MAAVEDPGVRAGLLMEAAAAQQSLAESALARLRDHSAGLDALVREEIRTTLLEELHALQGEVHQAGTALRRLQAIAGLRLTLWSCLILTLAAALPLIVAFRVLPSSAEVASLASRREELSANLARLRRDGGALELRRCGSAQRLCVRIERAAGTYGEERDFLVVKGY
jgi:hypothetical protein